MDRKSWANKANLYTHIFRSLDVLAGLASQRCLTKSIEHVHCSMKRWRPEQTGRAKPYCKTPCSLAQSLHSAFYIMSRNDLGFQQCRAQSRQHVVLGRAMQANCMDKDVKDPPAILARTYGT